MARRDLLNDDERKLLFGVPEDHDSLVKLYTLSRTEGEQVLARRGAANRLGFAVQMALLRHPGISLATFGGAPQQLVAFMAKQLGVPKEKYADYAARIQILSEHTRDLMLKHNVRLPAEDDLSLMIEAGARAAWSTEDGFEIATGIVGALRNAGILLPTRARIERTGIAGRAKARKQSYETLLSGTTPDQLSKLDALLVVDPKSNVTPLAWVREITTAPKADNVRGLIARLQHVRSIGIDGAAAETIHHSRFRQLAREGRVSPAHLLARYAPSRRRAILAALMIELEARLIDATLDMADRMIGGSFTRGSNTKQRVYAATTRDVGRLMRMFSQTIDALSLAQDGSVDAFTAVDDAVGWHKLLMARPQVKAISDLAEEDPLVRAADRWVTLRKFAPDLLEAISFKAGPGSAATLAAIQILRENARTGRRTIPDDAPMPFKKEWRALVRKGNGIDHRLYETAVMAHVRNKWRSGDIWVEGSTNYRRFDSYLLPQAQVPPIARALQLPATADEWIKTRAAELDWRLKGFASRLAKDKLEGVSLEGGKLSITPVRGTERPEVVALTAKIDALMPHVRITELLHDVAKQTGFLSSFTNLRTHEIHDNESALLATILADGSNLGLARMAEASQGVTPDQLLWTQSAYMREDTYKAALAKIINAHHALPIAAVWGQGTTSSSDGQFFRSGKRGGTACSATIREAGRRRL